MEIPLKSSNAPYARAMWRRITRLPHKRLQIHLCVEMQRINGFTPFMRWKSTHKVKIAYYFFSICGTTVPFAAIRDYPTEVGGKEIILYCWVLFFFVKMFVWAISRLSSNLALDVSKSRSPRCKVRLALVTLQRLLCGQFWNVVKMFFRTII